MGHQMVGWIAPLVRTEMFAEQTTCTVCFFDGSQRNLINMSNVKLLCDLDHRQ